MSLGVPYILALSNRRLSGPRPAPLLNLAQRGPIQIQLEVHRNACHSIECDFYGHAHLYGCTNMKYVKICEFMKRIVMLLCMGLIYLYYPAINTECISALNSPFYLAIASPP